MTLANPGDIAFIGFNADGDDDISFVTLVDIDPNTTVFFTDEEWNGINAFGGGESDLTWVSGPALIPAGTVISFTTIENSPNPPAANIGTVSGGMVLSSTSDEVYAYLGALRAPTTFLSAVSNGTVELANTGLTDGVNAISIGSSNDIGAYTGSRTFGDAASARAAINNIANWTTEGSVIDAHNNFTNPDVPFDTTLFALCFGPGTLIETPKGQVPVEDLSIGETILTSDGKGISVLWIGRQTISKARMGARSQPVRIRAGALGGGLPYNDLTVTADHGMIVEGLVINASALVNGDTIDFVPMDELADSFTVYHIETENHDVILANGAPAETFLDAVTRSHFDNYQEYLDLYGAERIIPEMDRPRISSRRLVPAQIKARLGIDDADDFLDVVIEA